MLNEKSLIFCKNGPPFRSHIATIIAVLKSTFTGNFCLNVPGTQCIIIWNLSNAKIRY